MTEQDFARALRAAQHGDPAGFDAVWRLTGPRLDRHLAVLDPERALAVATSTWVLVAAGLRSFSGGERAFRGVLARIARDELSARRRGVRRLDGRVVDLNRGRTVPCEPAGSHRYTSGEVARLLAVLSPEVGEMVALRVVIGLTSAETAALLTTRAGFVVVAVHGGLRRAAAAAYPGSSAVVLPNPWQLDRLLDRLASGEDGVPLVLSVLDVAVRRLVAALTEPARPGDPAQLAAARPVFERSARRHAASPAATLARVTAAGGPFVRPMPTL